MFSTGSSGPGPTQINFRPRNSSIQGVGMEDGVCLSGIGGLSAGSPLVIKRPASPVALPRTVPATRANALVSTTAIDHVHALVDR
ncbi:MAG: hypothetical protein H7Z14_06160 [Anaerolineae bacterium]|nr:hypothetical protein [Phycisphaerae bacterium]